MARIVTNSNLSYSAKYRIFNAIALNMRYSFYTFIVLCTLHIPPQNASYRVGCVQGCVHYCVYDCVPYCVQTAARHQQRSIVYFFILVCCAASTPPFSLPHKNASVPTSLRIFQTLSPINVKIYQGSVVILNIFFLFCPCLAIPRQIRYTHSIPFYK